MKPCRLALHNKLVPTRIRKALALAAQREH